MARMGEVVKAVRGRVVCNPLWKQKMLSREMRIATQMITRIICDDLGLCTFISATLITC